MCTIGGVVFSQLYGCGALALRVFLGSGVLCWFWLVFLFHSSCFLWQKVHLVMFGGKFSYRSCHRCSVFEPNLSSYFDARYTLIHRLLRDTLHSDGSTGIFWFCRRLFRPWGSLVTSGWSAGAREVFSSCSAWRSRSAIFCHAKAVLGHIVVDLLFDSSRGGACCTRAGLRRWQCHLSMTWVDFLLDVFVYALVTMYSLFMCGSNFTGIFFVRGVYL